MKTKVKIIVEGGKATPAPPLGPQLTMLGLKPPEVVKKINDNTKNFAGMKVPVEIEVDKTTKDYVLKVLMPLICFMLYINSDTLSFEFASTIKYPFRE